MGKLKLKLVDSQEVAPGRDFKQFQQFVRPQSRRDWNPGNDESMVSRTHSQHDCLVMYFFCTLINLRTTVRRPKIDLRATVPLYLVTFPMWLHGLSPLLLLVVSLIGTWSTGICPAVRVF